MKEKESSTSPSSNKDEFHDIYKRIGDKIRKLRKLKNSNYEDFAQQHGINKVTLSRIENGGNFTFNSLLIVLKALDVTLEEFFKEI